MTKQELIKMTEENLAAAWHTVLHYKASLEMVTRFENQLIRLLNQ